eukprot:3418318-Prymnesium_polylepis.1
MLARQYRNGTLIVTLLRRWPHEHHHDPTVPRAALRTQSASVARGPLVGRPGRNRRGGEGAPHRTGGGAAQ